MEKRYQVFVSSTYSDLRDERERVLKELTKIGYIAAGMEQFPSTDEDKFEYIQRVIEESDYYLVIIKGKYGSIDRNGMSYTEKEYEYACSIGRPTISFIYADRGDLRVSDTDNDPIRLGRLNEFVNRLEDKKIVSRWRTVNELVHSVKDSVNDLVRRKPAVGWVRGDKALDPKIINDLEALRRERDELRDALSKVVNGPEDGSISLSEEFVLRGEAGDRSIELKANIGQLLKWLSEILYLNSKESGVKYALEVWAGQQNPELTEPVKLEERYVKALRYKLDFAGLIKVLPQREETVSGMGTYLYWSMTDKAKKLLANSEAMFSDILPT